MSGCVEVNVLLIKGEPRAGAINDKICVPQELDETGSNLVLKGLGLAELDLRWRCLSVNSDDREGDGGEVTPLTSTALSSSGV
jgi:hypothetical protein